jgi:hypothetical protein
MKKSREDVDAWTARNIEEIMRYTTLELRLLARIMSDMRKSFDDMDGMRLRGWHGPGAAASALLERHNIKEAYPNDIAAENIPSQQDAAHHAFYGGRIEMLKQGYVENTPLHVYDIASAYPAAMVEFPSMKNGEWTRRGYIVFNYLSELRAIVESASQLSMFKIKYFFPVYEKHHSDISRAVLIPFYPLPYRKKGGGIIFPAHGYGWYMRDHALAAIAWLERFVPDYPRRKKKENKNTAFIIEEAWLFKPDDARGADKPFAVVRDLYNKRKKIQQESERTKKYDIREKTIKLPINSVYGQLARSVGTVGKVPFAANPYYAAATTAYCQRRLIEAALLNPHTVIFFATDGIVSTEQLRGLARMHRDKAEVELGDWEYCEADGGLFVMPGVYTYGKIETNKNGERTIKPVSKLRGADPKKYAKEMAANTWMISKTLEIWRVRYREQGANAHLDPDYKKYITAGNALASPKRWKLAGRWSPPPGDPNAARRIVNVGDPGGKRRLLDFEPDWMTTDERLASRCTGLIRTAAVWNDDAELSRPRAPEWLDVERETAKAEHEEQVAIACGFE